MRIPRTFVLFQCALAILLSGIQSSYGAPAKEKKQVYGDVLIVTVYRAKSEQKKRQAPPETIRASQGTEPIGSVCGKKLTHTKDLDLRLAGRIYARYGKIIESAARAHGADCMALIPIIVAESSGRPSAVSDVGAEGLMQIIPSTQKLLGIKDPKDPRQNINGGTKYLTQYCGLPREGISDDALGRYHAGHAATKFGPDSLAYIGRVTEVYHKLQSALS